MSLLGHLTVDELGPLLRTMHRSLVVDSHYALFNWLQDDVQRFIPHDIVIAVWGDFSLGMVCHDVVSSLQGARTGNFSDELVQPFAGTLFKRWVHYGRQPFFLDSTEGDSTFQGLDGEGASDMLHQMETGLVHGIKDQRGRHDCLYILLGDAPLVDGGSRARDALRLLLPYIDTAFRQVAHLPEQYYRQPDAAGTQAAEVPDNNAPVGELSVREMEIMEWVRLGKTNQEIGMILDISAFTVKNHMQRIFKKLDVLNRAQAVAKIDNLRHRGHPTRQ